MKDKEWGVSYDNIMDTSKKNWKKDTCSLHSVSVVIIHWIVVLKMHWIAFHKPSSGTRNRSHQ